DRPPKPGTCRITGSFERSSRACEIGQVPSSEASAIDWASPEGHPRKKILSLVRSGESPAPSTRTGEGAQRKASVPGRMASPSCAHEDTGQGIGKEIINVRKTM